MGALAGPGPTSADAAELLCVSRPLVNRLVRAGVLPVRAAAGRRLFPRAGVEAYSVAEHRRRESVLASMAPAGGYGPGDL